MLSEGGKVSHKRFISVIISIVIAFASLWAVIKYQEQASGVINSLLIFVLVMSGVATVAQIASIIKGVPLPKDEDQENRDQPTIVGPRPDDRKP